MLAVLFLLVAHVAATTTAAPTSTAAKKQVKAIYYVPSVVGLDPLNGEPDLYSSYMKPIHERDLEVISKIATHVRLSGMSFRTLDNDFLDLCKAKDLHVMATFSIKTYNLETIKVRVQKQTIVDDFKKFVREIKDHPSVTHFIIGDTNDPFFGADSQSLAPPGQTEIFSYIDLVETLLGILREEGIGNDRFPYAGMSIHLSPKVSAEEMKIAFNALLDAVKQNLDFLVIDTGDNKEPYTSDLSKNTTRESVFWEAIKKEIASIKDQNYRCKDQNKDSCDLQCNLQIVTQFSPFALNITEQVDENGQVRVLHDSWNRYMGNSWLGCTAGIVAMEFSDQWWRGDTAQFCNSGILQPYFQSRCDRGFEGLVLQSNTFGDHCISPRKAFAAFGALQNGDLNSPCLDSNITTCDSYAGIKVGSTMCVKVFPTFFSSHDYTLIAVALSGLMFVVACVLWCQWRRAKKRERAAIKAILDRMHIDLEQQKKKKGGQVPSTKESVNPVGSVEMTADDDVEEGPLRTRPVRIFTPIRTTIYYVFQQEKACASAGNKFMNKNGTPATGTTADKGPKRKERNDSLLFAELHFREHLRQQKWNLDAMIKHEQQVMQTLNDLALVNNEEDILHTAIRNVHTRMMEGYVCWLDKHPNLTRLTHDLYGEMLLYRVMSSLAEHIAHCPERMAHIFHQFMEAYKDDSNEWTIDMDVLQKGLMGPMSMHKGTINFDDINECGILGDNTLHKTWFESPGPAVVLDYLRDYDCIFFFKIWLFFLAAVVEHYSRASKYLDENWFESFVIPFCQYESLAFGIAEASLFLYHLLWQTRKLPKDRIPGLLYAMVCVVIAMVVIPMMKDSGDVALVGTICAYMLLRLAYCVLPMKSYLTCACVRKPRYVFDMQMLGRPFKKAATLDEEEEKKSSLRQPSTAGQALIFWIITFGISVMVEIVFIVPIAIDMTFDHMCYSSAENLARCLPGDETGSNICLGCFFSVICAWGLMFVTVFADTPLVFYLSVSACGYYKGQTRKLHNVYAQESCVVNLQANGEERKDMVTLYGDWHKSGYAIWVSMIDELYNRDLLCDSDRVKLQTPGRKWDFRLLNHEARQRLSFFLRTIKSMAKAKDHAIHTSDFQEENNEEIVDKDKLLYVVDEMHDEAMSDTVRRISAAQDVAAREAAMAAKEDFVKRITPKYKLKDSINMQEITKQLAIESADGLNKTSVFDEVKDVATWKPIVEDTFLVHDDGGSPLTDEEKKTRNLKPASSTTSLSSNACTVNPFALSDEEDMDRFLRCIPRLSHVITCYSETIILSREYLQSMNGQLTNIEHMIAMSSYQMEWDHFTERFKDKHNIVDREYDCLFNFLRARPRRSHRETVSGSYHDSLEDSLVKEVRLWASFRAQTIIRTIRGALSYHEALRQRFNCVERWDGAKTDVKLNDYVELIVAHQTYGAYPGSGSKRQDIDGWKERREDVEMVLKDFAHFPILLVYDYAAPPPVNKRTPSGSREEDFDFYWQSVCQPYWEKDQEEMCQYWQKRCKEYGLSCEGAPNFKNMTCVKRMVDGKLTLVSVMPRNNDLRIGEKDKTQGKAANQINALRVISGHVIQVSDANMDGWIGEGYKLPYITRMFVDGDVEKRLVGDRTSPIYRIIGFREYIFTGPLGPVAAAMASSEYTFGTLFQRVLTDPLNVRMHYGHPDFFDAFWVITRGTLSKASPRLNLSEDVFAGYNTVLRGEKVTHCDTLEWQKGRETVFTASSGFLTKISAGSVSIERTRDMKYMQLGLSFPTKLSLFYGGIGSFILHVLINFSIFFYVSYFTLASMSTITLSDIQRASSLGTEWLIGLGMVSSLGYLTEMMLEFGWGSGLIQVLRVLPVTSLFYLHQNQCMSASILDSIRTGDAQYFDSGRPNSFDHYSIRTMYHFYAESHYYPALTVFVMYYFYTIFTGGGGGILPMILVSSTTLAWIFAPVVFCPQLSDLDILTKDVLEAFAFLFSTRDKTDNKNPNMSMDKFWRTKEIKFHSDKVLGTRMVYVLIQVVLTVVLWAVSFSTFIDYALLYMWMWVGHILVTFIFFFSNYTNIIRGVWMLYPPCAMWVISYATPYAKPLGTESLFGLVLFLQLVRTIHYSSLALVTAGINLTKCCRSEEAQKEASKRYEKLTSNMFFFCFSFHVHLYSGIAIMAAQALFNIVLMLIVWVFDWLVRFYRAQLISSKSDYRRFQGTVLSS